MIEYVLLQGVNDSDQEATQLGQLLQSRARKAGRNSMAMPCQ